MKKFIKKYGLTILAVAVALIHSNRLIYALMQYSEYSNSLIIQIIGLLLFTSWQLTTLYLILDGGIKK